jgi:hypothetical protein
VVRNYSYYFRNNPEEGSSHPFRDGSLKSRLGAVLCDVIPLYFEVIIRERNIASLKDESSKDVCLHRRLSSFVCREDASEDIQCLSEQFMRYVVFIAVYGGVF